MDLQPKHTKILPLNSNEWSISTYKLPFIDFSHIFKTCSEEPKVCSIAVSYCFCLLIPALIILYIPTIPDTWQFGVIIYTTILLSCIIWLYFYVEWVTGPINTYRIYELFNMRTKFLLYMSVIFIILLAVLSHYIDILSLFIIVFFFFLLLLLFSGIYKILLFFYSLKVVNSIILIFPFVSIILGVFLLVHKNDQLIGELIY